MTKKITLIIIMISILIPGARSKSLLLPGWGELSLNQKSRGQKFFAADIILWLTVLNGKRMSKNYESDYRSFASEHASVDWDHADYLFAIDIGYYDTLSDYNNKKARQRSLEIETDPNGNLIRENGHGIYPENGDFNWEWDDTINRQIYKDLRLSSSDWDKYANFAISGLIINRVISLVDVIYLERTGKPTQIQSQIITKGISDLQLKFSFPF